MFAARSILIFWGGKSFECIKIHGWREKKAIFGILKNDSISMASQSLQTPKEIFIHTCCSFQCHLSHFHFLCWFLNNLLNYRFSIICPAFYWALPLFANKYFYSMWFCMNLNISIDVFASRWIRVASSKMIYHFKWHNFVNL